MGGVVFTVMFYLFIVVCGIGLPKQQLPRSIPREVTSELPVSCWHERIGDPTLADGILDRLAHHAHRIEKRGDSMRKNRGKASTLTASSC